MARRTLDISSGLGLIAAAGFGLWALPAVAQTVAPVSCLVGGSVGQNGLNPGGWTGSFTGSGSSGGSNATFFALSLGADGNGASSSLGGFASGPVAVTASGRINAPAIQTPGTQGLGGLINPQSGAIWAESIGGCGYANDSGAGHGGAAGAVSVSIQPGTSIQLGANVAGIYALSAGGQGSGYSHDSTHNVRGGGAGGDVFVSLSGAITTPSSADNAYGIYALSVGGASGATDNTDSLRGGNAGDVAVNLLPGASIALQGDGSVGVYAVSAGGLSWYADNGTSNGHQNGDGGDVGVAVQKGASIATSGELGIGILAASTGGNANTNQAPPDSLENGGAPNSVPTDLAPPGNAGDVAVLNQGSITTQGDVAIGIAAVSSTGGRGAGLLEQAAGGNYEIDPVGQTGPGAGTPGVVSVINTGSITTSGVGASGILALSLGGSGGVMDSKPGLLNLLGGHTAGTGADGNAVAVANSGSIATTGAASMGILAESIGGGGGTATGTGGVIAIGSNGGVGGNGGPVAVAQQAGSIATQGDDSFGILAHSVGGGGGNGANATGLVASVGGAGGASGNGAAVAVSLGDIGAFTIATTGNYAPGIGAQSVGGGGGNGGGALALSTIFVSAAVGGSGGAGGDGGAVTVTGQDGTVTTAGAHAPALLAQSIGGGGGNGGAADVLTASVALAVDTAIGGNGAKGGNGNAVTVSGSAGFQTIGKDSAAILAQSIGGGGGNGGSALAQTQAIGVPDVPSISISTAVGGVGGVGGAGGAVTVASSGDVATAGDGSAGILAQSVGGGGGNGGDASALARAIGPSATNVKIGVSVGGNGQGGGAGGTVAVMNTGSVETSGANAAGLLAQSIGGGGGTAGIGNGGVTSQNLGSEITTAIDLSLGLGGTGGSGGLGGSVTVNNEAGAQIVTTGSGAQGILAQSIGGGGGNAGGGVASGSGDDVVINVAVGRDGGNGVDGGAVTVTSSGTIRTGALVTNNGESYVSGGDGVGILAQSIGGGGGVAGSSDATAPLGPLFQLEDLLNNPDKSYEANVAIGGTGGSAGNGGTVTVSTNGTITTLGERAFGILAQSIGGGGGSGGAATSQASAVAGGGQGGESGGNAGAAATATPGSSGEDGSGSEGGGGGSEEGGQGQTYAATVSVGGTGGGGGNGGTVSVSNLGSRLTTTGYGAVGMLAQSIGGGGGVGAEGTVNNHTTIGLGGDWNGGGGSGGDGGAVSVMTGAVATLGDDAPGVLAQSIGGGGGAASAGCSNSIGAGLGGISATLCAGNQAGISGNHAPWNDSSDFTLDVGGGAGTSGKGGLVQLNVEGAIQTTGARSIGAVAQSISGGGGYVSAAAANIGTASLAGKPGANGGHSAGEDGVIVSLDNGASITTSGAGGWGILAQSVAGGGGFAGDPSQPIVSLVSNSLTSSQSSDGAAGNITVTSYGTILTTGAEAHGIVAQSVGGSGGIVTDPSLGGVAFGNSAQIYGTAMGSQVTTAGAVTIDQEGGTIAATGTGSVGILAQSSGIVTSANQDQTPVINVTVGGRVIGGTLAGYTAGQGPAGIMLSGGGYVKNGQPVTANSITVNPGGFVSTVDGANGYAIVTTDGWTNVLNNGTVLGSIGLEQRQGTITNNGHLYAGSDVVANTITNAGMVNVSGPGVIGTTTIYGNYTQTAAGVLATDIDALAAQKADLLGVNGSAAVAGTVQPLARNLLPGTYTVFLSGGLTEMPNVQSSLLYNWQLSGASSPGFAITPYAHFTPPGVTLDAAETSLAQYLTNGWNAADPHLAPVFGYLSQVGGGAGGYKAVLDSLSPEAAHALSSALIDNAGTILGASLSCPVFVDSNTLLGEDRCVWSKVTGTWTNLDRSSGNGSDAISAVTYRMGAQKPVAPGWYLGGSLGLTESWQSGSEGSSGNGTTFDGSMAVKRVIGPWLLAGSFAVANGSFQNDRVLSLPATGTQPAVLSALTSNNDTLLLGGRLRAGYEFTFPHWYLRPYLDGDVVYTHTPSYQESGNSTYALQVGSSNLTTFIATPSLEIGNRIDLDPKTVLRGYLTLGASIRSNDQRSVSASFVGASGSDGSFETYIDSPSVTGQVALGVALYRLGGFEARAEYDLAGGSDFLSQGGTLRLAYHF